MNGIYHFNVGEFDCVAIDDGGFIGTGDMLFANAPADLLARALDDRGESASSLPSPWTCLLVNCGSELVLLDTGGGPGGENGGKLIPALSALGVNPEAIDTVVLTHVHSDHTLGAIREDGTPAFANATYVMSETEWAYWTEAETLAEAPPWAAKTARKVLPALRDRMRTVATPGTVVEGIRLLPAHGHTPGHSVVEITSGGEQLLFLSDTALHPLHLEHPDWVATLDQDPEQTPQTRRRVFQRAADQQALVLLFHFAPFPGLGHIVEQGSTWRWRMAPEHAVE